LNRRFRGKDKATDVLSFPQLDGARRSASSRIPTPIGDVVISVETASRQAAELKQTVAHRLRSLVIHGYLHLLGYDHERSPAEARRMFSREAALAKALPPIRSRRSTV
jgi:rRNA maturation RNase YbeY